MSTNKGIQGGDYIAYIACFATKARDNGSEDKQARLLQLTTKVRDNDYEDKQNFLCVRVFREMS